MSARIRIGGVEATLNDERTWTITQVDGTSPSLVRSLERLLNSGYGIDWLPAFGVYEPSMVNAAAQAVAIDLGAEVLELDPIGDSPEGRIH